MKSRLVNWDKFDELFRKAVIDRQLTAKQYIGSKNHVISAILGSEKLSYDKFVFVMNKVLGEPIPLTDPIVRIASGDYPIVDIPLRDTKYVTRLHSMLYDILRDARITESELKRCIKESISNAPDTDTIKRMSVNSIMNMIRGCASLGIRVFKFIVENVLHRDLPDDIYIDHLLKFGTKVIDISGHTYGRLTAINLTTVKRGDQGWCDNRGAHWRCRCACGNELVVSAGQLHSGNTASCGCLQRECISNLAKEFNVTHGMSGTPEYHIWSGMKKRCTNVNDKAYIRYGGRGIEVCDRWRESFENFYEDMGPRPEGLSIDRIDNDGNYEPGNCKWSTHKEQSNNKRNTITLDGTTLSQWAADRGLSHKSVYGAYYRYKELSVDKMQDAINAYFL